MQDFRQIHQILARIVLESTARRLVRNRFPIRGGTYGGSFGWTGVP